MRSKKREVGARRGCAEDGRGWYEGGRMEMRTKAWVGKGGGGGGQSRLGMYKQKKARVD